MLKKSLGIKNKLLSGENLTQLTDPLWILSEFKKSTLLSSFHIYYNNFRNYTFIRLSDPPVANKHGELKSTDKIGKLIPDSSGCHNISKVFIFIFLFASKYYCIINKRINNYFEDFIELQV